ncbi:3-oxoacyl-[acyl-carrier-protein] synthase III C-terminal domain-containing protein [Nonomuraea guangzhouensis]|uniref:3-oxoacyl-[acyl-carrier-protein] synthase III C-terminal domain-containing protein n=1 Tax=Nonomuraea guangzhouensis TaxID=1291555 RepID=A0ABW4FZA1_9ACTN|nr:3-oxoacyl-[acyl-carrier-protein] synthase III C-terminal domain-containing protein [Nonomuraea guangzhouensis]
MPASIAVRSAAWYMPDSVMAVSRLPELDSMPEPERETCLRLGIEQIRAEGGLSELDLMARAARRALTDADLEPGDLGALVVVESRAPETLMSSEATRLQAVLGARNAVTFSVGGLGCVSITPALLAARGLLAADEELEYVLVAHGSKPITPGRYRHPVTVSGDSGQALVLSRHGRVRVVDILQESNGDYWDLFRVDYREQPPGQWREECADTHAYSFSLALETRSRLRELNRRLLERNAIKPTDISGYFSQNLSLGSFRFSEESLGISIDPACFDNLRRYGHLGPNDTLLNLYTAIERGDLAGGQRAILLNVSPVAAWSALLVESDGGDGDVHHL